MFSLIRKKHLLLSFLMVALLPSISFGQIDYCTLSEKRINIHLKFFTFSTSLFAQIWFDLISIISIYLSIYLFSN